VQYKERGEEEKDMSLNTHEQEREYIHFQTAKY
jgi:hypothetical protein